MAYRPPVNDMAFVLEHLVGISELSRLDGFEELDMDTVVGLLDEAGRFCAEQLEPLNRTGDAQPARVDGDRVIVADGFSEAYSMFVENGWNGIAFEPEYGGGGLPWTLGVAVQEMVNSSNMSFALCPLLTQGAVDMLMHHASEEQKETYLHKLVSGEWTGTMNLTEPHAGSDVGALTTRAVRADDGTYRITGTKIFITFGEHEMAENIVHLVLARTPDAPAGTKGISCFIVPKYLVNPDGSLGQRNDLAVVSTEHKIGIHASPTCVMSFGDNGGAVGYLIGEENQGMRYMFTMMNNARLSVGIQGLAIAEIAMQLAADYARERKQGRPIGADANAAIVEHADIRRSLMTMKSHVEAMRGLMYLNAAAMDRAAHCDGEQAAAAASRAALLTPLSKGWGTDCGVEVASLGIQVHGGMGYIEETGAAQHWRDSRILPIYEGTNGIQALDLAFRKLPLDGGGAMRSLVSDMRAAAEAVAEGPLADIGNALSRAVDDVEAVATWMATASPNDIAAGATPYLTLVGTAAGGWVHVRSAAAALALLEAGRGDAEFLNDKIASAQFFCSQVLPKTASLVAACTAGADPLFAVAAERF
ncbi:MAG: acyl-CoA dehydrogenase [Acidimicrobiales bacterium]